MHVPIFVPHPVTSSGRHTTQVVNKTIVYQDAILDLKDKGGNLKVTQISVPVSELENCLNIIFEANPDVVFNTVQYSYQNKKVIFYTNRNISTEKWENRKVTLYKPVSNAETLAERVQSVLEYEDDLNPELVSAYSVWLMYKQVDEDFKKMRDRLSQQIEGLVKLVNPKYYIYLHEPHIFADHVTLAIHTDDWNHFCFRKENGDLYIHRAIGDVNFNLLKLVGAYVEEYYDYWMSLDKVSNQYVVGRKHIDSGFFYGFMKSGVHVCNDYFLYSSTFTVDAFSSAKGFNCECNSHNVLKLLTGREDEFVQKIFVSISDCPKWMQEKLKEMRIAQFEKIVAEQKAKEEEERKRAEKERIEAEKIARELARKQKRREFWKKIFPFIK